MMAEVENLVLDHLGHIRSRLDRMVHKLEDLVAHTGNLERSVADHSVQHTEINLKLNRLDARLTRIEKRLDLVEG
jgi:chromosome segregation ATPase